MKKSVLAAKLTGIGLLRREDEETRRIRINFDEMDLESVLRLYRNDAFCETLSFVYNRLNLYLSLNYMFNPDSLYRFENQKKN